MIHWEGFKAHLLGYPHFFRKEMVYQPTISPQILTNHIRYSQQVNRLIPYAKKITILRDPYNQFISIFEYFHHIGAFQNLPHGTEGLKLFLEKKFNFYT